MAAPLVWGMIWVVVAACVAALPRRFHPWGAIPLLITALPLVVLIYRSSGVLFGLVAVAVLVSVLRYPLLYLGRRMWLRLTG
ncbi:hypothetical protein U879_18085 [Defluviimonas sp. 20V17]|uniref:DUF2484 family protein n=1 Tax=Allgaiera indica TaxID=765699 RepID=A0AAN4US00_9RHOB|nr:DUF2484 family protein [Allgaiera indica]KDB02298.1 hypothetical protein U879_18085 [Defluviimonas sp. 20V17]GHE02790.1 hypothetical protein GCM10008024_23720 [Allgaiera indica]SDX17703.1 Protein of unknown function [Allgaiera indica]